MTDSTELGRYLRARRERVKPADVGLPAGTGLRRTPGLRREELASLAGVSTDYYTRLERGREAHPSAAVLDALARVLLLDSAETAYLHTLVASRVSPVRLSRTVRPTALLLLESLRPNPAYVVSRTNDLLAANPGGLGLLPGLADWPPLERNITRYVFLHPAARTLWEDWEQLAVGTVAHLRAVAGADPSAPDLTALVGELLVKSEEFGRLWGRYDVRPRSSGSKAYRHPVVGRMRLEYEAMPLTDADGQRLIAYVATPGTPDHDAMTLLDLVTVPTRDPREDHANHPPTA
ncbi:helix-turn-helix transcriptional regulator [Nonomuraea sp. NPDC050556]|uniref:helix-turn-helix transcriptional regulator n=1 Tax=Nonomuraea sp. NPDC050556 TaxID=3364369 RepID=UPI0037BC6FE5